MNDHTLTGAVSLLEARAGVDYDYRVRADLQNIMQTISDAQSEDLGRLRAELTCLQHGANFDLVIDPALLDIEYVTVRFQKTVSPFMRLRYAATLWCAGRRHESVGRAAVDAAFEIVDNYRIRDEAEPTGHWGLKLRDYLSTLAALAHRFKHRVEELRRLLLHFIEHYPSENSCCLVIRVCAGELAILHKLGDPAYQLILETFEPWGKELVAKDHWFQAIRSVYPTAKRAAAKLGSDTRKWDGLIGEAYEEMASDRIQHPLVASEFQARAARAFRLGGLSDRAEACERAHSETKLKAEYQHSHSEVDISELIDDAQQAGEAVADQGEDVFFLFLVADSSVVPDWKAVEKQASIYANSLAFSFLPAELRDIRGNTAEVFSGDKGMARYRELTAMKFWSDMQMRWIAEVLLVGVRRGILTTERVLDVVFSSWLGKRFAPTGIPEPNGLLCWAELVAPALIGIVEYLQYLAGSRPVRPDLVCFIDSLSLKFEGILRQYLQCSGETVTKASRSRTGHDVQRELDINDILSHPRIAQALGRSDLELMRFVLVEHGGLNLRNNIAHALLPERAYGRHMAVWLFVMIFRVLRMNPDAPSSSEETAPGSDA